MMALMHILGRGDDGWGGIIGFVIVLIVWGVGLISQAASKRKKNPQEARRLEEIREHIEAERRRSAPSARQINPNLARRQPAVLIPPGDIASAPRIRPALARQAPTPIPPARRAAPHPAVAPAAPVAPVTRSTAAPTVQAKQPITQTQMGSGSEKPARPGPAGATAQALSQWMQPATLRQQFILTEIFQPPVGLREW